MSSGAPWPFRVVLALLIVTPAQGRAEPPGDGPWTTATHLARMLQAARSVISDSQDLINDPGGGDKGLTGTVVLTRTLALYRAATGHDPLSGDPAAQGTRLLRQQMDAIKEVVDANQDVINARDVGFKAFIPAVFARLANEAFQRKAGDEASIKVTAPPDLVRNRKSLPDEFEARIIRDRFLSPSWSPGQSYEETVTIHDRPKFRLLMPEYYAPSCLTCHGTPRGSADITGYPREGGHVDDLGAVISVIVSR